MAPGNVGETVGITKIGIRIRIRKYRGVAVAVQHMLGQHALPDRGRPADPGKKQ